jgi:hypothetical protein
MGMPGKILDQNRYGLLPDKVRVVALNHRPISMLHIIPNPHTNARKKPSPNDTKETANWNPVNIPIDALLPKD